MNLVHEAKAGSADSFFAEYDPSHANDVDSTGRTILMAGLGNTDPSARVPISNRLLDDGSDATATKPDGVNCLHVLLGAARHDFDAEPRLLQRLLDGGADINAPAKKFGTPLQDLIGNFSFTDADYAPFYEVIFACDDLDLLTLGGRKKSALDLARTAGDLRADLLQRMESYLREHDIDIPEED